MITRIRHGRRTVLSLLLAAVLLIAQSAILVYAASDQVGARQTLATAQVSGLIPFDDPEGGDPGSGGTDPGGGGGTDPGGGGGTDPGGGGGTDPGGGGGTDPGGGGGTDPGGGGTDPGGGGTDPTDPEVVVELMLQDNAPDSSGNKHFVGEDWDPSYKQLSILEKGKTLQLNGFYVTNRSKPLGLHYETADGAAPLGTVSLTWRSSDNNIATVTPNGLVTPRGNGTVTITATVSDAAKYAGTAPAKSVEIVIDGQEGEYVTAVDIIDASGNILGRKNGDVLRVEQQNGEFRFYALVTWSDVDGNVIRVEDTRSAAVTSTMTWTLSGSAEVATINESTGRMLTHRYSGSVTVFCTVTGGVGGKSFEDYVPVTIDTGEYNYNPADSLTVKVVYEKGMDQVAQETTYSLGELASKLPSYTYYYTILGGNRYGCLKAQGYYLKDIAGLEGVNLDDILEFRFQTLDGYMGDSPISKSYLLDNNRYYFPNWDLGGSRQDPAYAPPMLAYLTTGTIWNHAEVNPTLPLKEGERFRLVFGPTWAAESNSANQRYSIYSVTIVLKGAPPLSEEDRSGPDKGPGTGTEKGAGTEKNGTGTSGAGIGASSDSGSDSGKGDKERADSTLDNDATNRSGEGANTGGGAESRKWRVYEMISNQLSHVAPIDYDLPLLPLAAPVALISVIAGAGFTYGGFRRRLT